MIRLKKLKAKACRGILDGPDLEFGRDGVVLAGDNGTGKSSYIDALEKVMTGRCGSLDTGDQGLSWSKQGKNVASKAPPEIELVVGNGAQDCAITQDGLAPNCESSIKAMLTAAGRQSFLLRRRTLLAFINAKPADRYRAVADFLRLERFNEFEGKTLLTTCQNEIAAHKRTKQIEEIALRQQLNISPATSVDETRCIESVNATLATAGLSPLVDIQSIPDRAGEVDRQLAAFSKMEEVQKLQLLKTLTMEVPAVDELEQLAVAYRKERQTAMTEETKLKGKFYQQVLEEGVKWIRADSLKQCPLCESAIDPVNVIKRVQDRLDEHKELSRLRSSQHTARTNFAKAVTVSADALVRVKSKWTDSTGADLPKPAQELIDLLNRVAATHATLREPSVIERDVMDLSSATSKSVVASLRTAIDCKLKNYPSTDAYERLAKAKAALHAMLLHWKKIAVADAQIERLENARSQVQRVLELAEKARKKAVQHVLDQIATHADEYFQKIHPRESIGNPKLKVTERGTASIDLTCVFHKKPGDPRGCYSEGHVDSLGLCIFLAIRRFHYDQDPALSLLVLDDVLHSVDGEHRMATAKLILKEFADHQIVITTHDPLWFENLKAVARVAGRNFSYHRIAGWSLSTGPIWGDHLSDYEWLVSKAAITAQAADRLIKAGRLLEQILQNLCDRLTVAVPFSLRGLYTLDPLWTSFMPRAKKNREFYTTAGQELDKIEEMRGLRNLAGAHYNEWARYLTDNESKELTQAIVKLRQHVYCPTCNEFIKRIAGLKGVWSCKGEHLRFKE
jgi:ABC-type Mn2+/Zn2+ transport system ATPase subunit